MTDDDDDLSLLRRIEANTVRASADGRACETVGPFFAAAHPTNDMIWLSYAVPLSAHRGRADVAAAVPPLRAWFKRHNRRLRFEILEPLWPELAGQLLACGVELQGRMPLMLCAPDDLRPVDAPTGVSITPLEASVDDDVLRESMAVARRAFGEGRCDPSPQEVAEHRDAQAKGRYRTAAAWLDGTIVAVGTMSVGNDELVGIATAPEFRRRGIAAAVSHHLLADHFRRGGHLAWLSAGDDPARRVYARIGFRLVGDQVNLMDQA
jgi:GNAT superfamily N-acetyltransferase